MENGKDRKIEDWYMREEMKEWWKIGIKEAVKKASNGLDTARKQNGYFYGSNFCLCIGLSPGATA